MLTCWYNFTKIFQSQVDLTRFAHYRLFLKPDLYFYIIDLVTNIV